jgi:superfamily II DNA or RNA helicase
LAEIFNRHEGGSANWVCGNTPKEDRRKMFSDFAAKKFRILVNVGVATEGFDDPGIEVVVIARPTKSRSLYAQMIGRGTRTLPGVVDRAERDNLFTGQWEAKDRLAAIASSAKKSLLVLDFVGNAGRHKLVTTADILGGKHTDDVIEKAAKKAAEAGKPMNMLDALDAAEEEARKEREVARLRDEAKRAALKPEGEVCNGCGRCLRYLRHSATA